VPAGIPFADLVRRDRWLLLGSAAAVTALAWITLVASHPPSGSAEDVLRPHAHPAGLPGLGLAFGMWMVMMIGMMLPPVLPWIMLFAAGHHGRGRRGTHRSTSLVTAGYFIVWSAYSLAAAGTQRLLHLSGWIDHGGTLAASAGGVLLITAGLFQFTPFKAACLAHCRSPMSFFLTQWRDGPIGALGMGMRHGTYCLGCCWALMAVGFAVGVMNLIWMAALTVFLCIEKIAPGGALTGRAFGAVLVVWGVWNLAA
jgi:predicted metal-binding membrane protein